MREIATTTRFIKDLRRAKKRGRNLTKLASCIEHIRTDMLPKTAQPHKLAGQKRDIWDLHIEPDWILLYEIDATTLTLIRTGSHADLF